MNRVIKYLSICSVFLIVVGCKDSIAINKVIPTEINVSSQTNTPSTNKQEDQIKEKNLPNSTNTPVPKQDKLTIDDEKTLIGSINDNLPIHMKLAFKEGNITGSYYYDKYKNDINLAGSMDSEGNINLTEKNPEGEVTGYFSGWMSKQNRFVGIWVDKEGKNKFPFNLNRANEPYLNLRTQDWIGTWERLNETKFAFAHLNIASIQEGQFNFTLDAGNGANSGIIEGQTALVKQDFGIWKNNETTFIFLLTEDGYLYVDATNPTYYAGAGVSFKGLYRKGHQEPKEYNLVDLKILKNSNQEETFKKLVGSDYEGFMDTLQIINEEKDLDGFGATAISGGVRGLFTIREVFIMFDGKDHIWAALLNDDQLNYYTNSNETQSLPKTLENWKSRFKNAKVNYKNK